MSGFSGKSAGFDLLNKIIRLLYFGFIITLFFLIKHEALEKQVVFDFKNLSLNLANKPYVYETKTFPEKTDLATNESILEKFNCLFTNHSARHFAERGKQSATRAELGFLSNVFQKISNESFKKKEFFRRQPKYQEFHLAGYKKELAKHFEVSMRMAVANADPSMQKLYSKFGRHVKFFLEINRDGSIKNLELTPKTALDDFNIFFINAIRSAAPFPPIPNFFKNSSFIF